MPAAGLGCGAGVSCMEESGTKVWKWGLKREVWLRKKVESRLEA